MRLKWIAVFALVMMAVCSAEEPAATKPVILLTGFEPFGGSTFNTSWMAVSQFEGQVVAGHTIKTAQLKVVYDKIDGPLAAEIEKLKPVAVISFGEGSAFIQLERTARNGYHPQKPKDNEGKVPPRDAIVPGAPNEIPTGLPVDSIIGKLNTAGIKATDSTNAGGYLCNECFYRLMSIKSASATRGFIHVPVVQPGNTAGRRQLRDALRIIITTVIENKK
ncbi:MAG: pyroglutamyl-peptidase I [Planctomycetota bacterium]